MPSCLMSSMYLRIRPIRPKNKFLFGSADQTIIQLLKPSQCQWLTLVLAQFLFEFIMDH